MSTFTVHRLATTDEMGAEIDRRGEVIERLETNVRHWREECGKLHAKARLAVWSPIERAPTDGRWIIARGTDNSVYRVSWGRNHNNELAWCSVAGSFVPGYLTAWIDWPEEPTP